MDGNLEKKKAVSRAGCVPVLFWMQCKKYAKRLPVMAAEGFLFGALLLIFGIAASGALYGERAVGEIQVGIVSGEEKGISELLTELAGSMDSTEGFCRFQLMEEEEAYQKLEKGELYAAIVLPEGIVESILKGENLPARVVFSGAHSKAETEVFRELTEAGAGLLATAQSGIYAADELCVRFNKGEWLEEAEDYLNRAYLRYALNRESVFELSKVHALGQLPLKQYYGGAALLLFLCLAGLMLGRAAERRQTALTGVLKAGGCPVLLQYLADHFAFALLFAGFGMACSFVFFLFFHELFGRMGETGGITAGSLLLLVSLLLSLGMMLRALLEITGSGIGGMAAAFGVLLLLMALGGLFLPYAFLPEWAEQIGRFTPLRSYMESLTCCMEEGNIGDCLFITVCWSLVFTLLGCLAKRAEGLWR